MAETTKKAKAPAKPRKSGTKKTAAPADGQQINGSVAETPVITAQAVESQPAKGTSHDEIARLAHQYWNDRGRQHGRHEDDWYRAEQALHKRAS